MTRRQSSSLIALVLLGFISSYFLQDMRPLWREAADPDMVSQVLRHRGSPESVWGKGELTVVMFTDYQCPACRKADPALWRAIARDRNVRVTVRDWPIFGERSERAATVSLSAQWQDIYFSVHRRLMKSTSLDDAALRDVVEGAGGDWKHLEADLLRQERAIKSQLADNRSDAFVLGLRGTPGFLIGPLIVEGALSEREFLRVFKKARSES